MEILTQNLNNFLDFAYFDIRLVVCLATEELVYEIDDFRHGCFSLDEKTTIKKVVVERKRMATEAANKTIGEFKAFFSDVLLVKWVLFEGIVNLGRGAFEADNFDGLESHSGWTCKRLKLFVQFRNVLRIGR